MENFKLSVALSILVILFFAACNSRQQILEELSNTIDTAAYLHKGDSISANVQKVLLTNVMQAMKSGGPGYAVTFCNEKAMPLTDSLAKKYNCVIQRVSDKYRNPANNLSGNDAAVLKAASTSSNPVLIFDKGQLIYYKPIKIAIPTCLNCHGTAGKEMDPKTAEIIRIKYPEDKATGYKEGDIRGLWKISFKAH